MTGAGALSAYRTVQAVHMMIQCDQRAAAHKRIYAYELARTQGCMASALELLDVRPDFYAHDGTCTT